MKTYFKRDEEKEPMAAKKKKLKKSKTLPTWEPKRFEESRTALA